ncbi:hypothetical protein MAR_035110 [Mya arenaria]|uniref:Uncharacterized protein n=1 Tax=Mya arenaria TaxID=6604 RepID=A0ABY7ELN7_MYAAR|nr:hypothetical protein MAR_035110 [Mya arenaria]
MATGKGEVDRVPVLNKYLTTDWIEEEDEANEAGTNEPRRGQTDNRSTHQKNGRMTPEEQRKFARSNGAFRKYDSVSSVKTNGNVSNVSGSVDSRSASFLHRGYGGGSICFESNV